MRIFKTLDDEALHDASLAIAIGGEAVSDHPDRRHVGIFFKPSEEAWQLIHLGWHGYFKIGEPSDRYCVVEVGSINSVVLANLADWLPEMLAANDGHMAYSIKPFDQDPFDENGKVKFSKPGDGFTCATFVLWAFYHLKVPILSLEGWEDRPEDMQWREWIMEMLRDTREKFGITDEHIAAQEPFVAHAARFRPEEVAGAIGEYAGKPSTFPEAVQHGVFVLEEMRKLGKLILAVTNLSGV